MLLRGSEETQTRRLSIVGGVTLMVALLTWVALSCNVFSGSEEDQHVAVVIETRYVGQGVRPGTAVVLHGVQVGEVTALSALPAGGVRLETELEKGPVIALTDSVKIDYRPANYFGVTGINLVAGEGGQPLRDGSRIVTEPLGNFTLSALLSRLGDVSSVANAHLVSVIDRVTRYVEGLTPLLETVLISMRAVADVQSVPTAQLLRNTTGIAVVMPAVANCMIKAGDLVTRSEPVAQMPENVWQNNFLPTLHEAETGLFASMGRLLTTHMNDILPVVNSVTSLTQVIPPLVRPPDFAYTITELRSRLERMYAGSGEQRALQIRIVLDNLPGIAAPLGTGGA